MTVRRRRRGGMTPRQIAWLVWMAIAIWPLVAYVAGYRASWMMIIVTSVASALLVWLLDHRKPRRRSHRITTLPRSNMAKPAASKAPVRQMPKVITEPVLPTPRTRLKAKLAAAAELAELHGYANELRANWADLDVVHAETADVVTQREIEQYPIVANRKLTEWLADSEAKHKREAS